MTSPPTVSESPIAGTPTVSSVVAKNAYWSGIESLAALTTAFLTSIAIARAIGPTNLAQYAYINWLTNVSGNLGSLGIPLATGKYMAEYLARKEEGIARAIYLAALRTHALLASVIVLLGTILVFAFYDRAYRWMAIILIISVIPQMMTYIPSQANNAAERLDANTPGAVAGMTLYCISVAISLKCGWGVVGIAFSTLLWQTAELAVKSLAVRRWIRHFPVSPLPSELRQRMRAFSGRSLGLMAINMLVWNRSDVVFLRIFGGDIRQIAFFSLPFNMVEKVQLVPQTFARAITTTLLAERGRNPDRITRISELSLKYVLFCGIPLLLGLAALSKPVIHVLYGTQYAAAAPVLAVVALLAISKTICTPVQGLYAATEKLSFQLKVTSIGAVVKVILDLALIPALGALGAALANGLSQTLAALWLWLRAKHVFGLKLDGATLTKILVCGGAMAIAVAAIAHPLRPVTALLAGTATGGLIFLVLTWKLAIFSDVERSRIWQACLKAPGWSSLPRSTPKIPRVAMESDDLRS